MNVNNFFEVHHIYQFNGEDETKYIGVFSSLQKAQEAIILLKDQPGFRDYPIEYFKISEARIDTIEDVYLNGFIYSKFRPNWKNDS
jgi:hypothetical protein